MRSQVKLFLLLVSIVSMLFLVQIRVVQATPETVVKVEPYASSYDVGETFSVNLTIVDVQNLYGIEVALYWNASMLRVVNVDLRLGVESYPDGVLHELSWARILVVENNVTQKEGEYRLAATSMSPAPSFYGSGNVVRIIFNATSSGYSKLDLETKLFDYPPLDREPRVSLQIAHTTIDAFTAIIPEISSATFLALFMLSLLLAVAFSKIGLKNSQSCLQYQP